MIDVHCHVLPFIDDGAADWDASLSMVRMALDEGINQCVATPHWTGAPGEAEKVRAQADELRTRLAAEGLHYKVHLGNEVVLVPRLVESLKSGTANTLGESSYVLLETAQLEQGAYTHNALFQLQSSGYRVILAHPERVRGWQGGLDEIRELLQRGCHLQINAGSLCGDFGAGAQKAAEELLGVGWVSILATDAHSPNSRPPRLRSALERCTTLIGERAAQDLVGRNPTRVLCNEQLPYPDSDAVAKKRAWFSLPWSRK